jgi:hypothetical protein
VDDPAASFFRKQPGHRSREIRFYMPLEIRELVIRVTVNESPGQPSETLPEDRMTELQDQVIRECMEKIMQKIERLNER